MAGLKLAFVGGNGHHYLRTAWEAKRGDFSGLAVAGDGVDDAAAKRMLDRVPGAKWYAGVDEMLEDFKPDLVSVGAVYAYNARVIRKAVAKGVSVVSDKPIASTWPDLREIERALLSSPARIITEFDMRCRSCFQAAKATIASGAIGKVSLATAQKSYKFGSRPAWYGRRSDYGGTLLWVAAHGIDAVAWATGLDMVPVAGSQGNLAHPELAEWEDHVVCMYHLQGGASGMVHADMMRPESSPTHGDDRLRVIGTKGVVEVIDGRCIANTGKGPADITDNHPAIDPGLAMLEAALGQSEAMYSTQDSLRMADLLLRSRDVCDGLKAGCGCCG